MSKQNEIFMRSQIEEELQARKEYIEKPERIRKGKFIKVSDFSKKWVRTMKLI